MPTSAWPSGRWTPTISSASAASRFWPRTRPSTTRTSSSTSSIRPGHADFGGEVERTLVDGGRRDAAGGRLGRSAAADAVRAAQGPRTAAAADCRHQQDRPARRPSAGGAERDLRPVHRSRRHRRAARLSGALHERAEPGTATREPDDARRGSAAAVRRHRRARAAAARQSRRAAADARREPRFERLPRPHRHRPHFQRPREDRRSGRRVQAGRHACTRPRSPSSMPSTA